MQVAVAVSRSLQQARCFAELRCSIVFRVWWIVDQLGTAFVRTALLVATQADIGATLFPGIIYGLSTFLAGWPIEGVEGSTC